MDCHYCKGIDSVEEQVTTFCACEIPDPFVVENVPAFVCRLCGDKSFSGTTLTDLERIGTGRARPSRMKVVRLFDFQDLQHSAPPAPVRGFYQGIVTSRARENFFFASGLSAPKDDDEPIPTWGLNVIAVDEVDLPTVQVNSFWTNHNPFTVSHVAGGQGNSPNRWTQATYVENPKMTVS